MIYFRQKGERASSKADMEIIERIIHLYPPSPPFLGISFKVICCFYTFCTFGLAGWAYVEVGGEVVVVGDGVL
jgi:hypothetical protein